MPVKPVSCATAAACAQRRIVSSISSSRIARGGTNCAALWLRSGTADGASGSAQTFAGVCRPGWLSCIHRWLPPTVPASA
jgi:hypothetical protein